MWCAAVKVQLKTAKICCIGLVVRAPLKWMGRGDASEIPTLGEYDNAFIFTCSHQSPSRPQRITFVCLSKTKAKEVSVEFYEKLMSQRRRDNVKMSQRTTPKIKRHQIEFVAALIVAVFFGPEWHLPRHKIFKRRRPVVVEPTRPNEIAGKSLACNFCQFIGLSSPSTLTVYTGSGTNLSLVFAVVRWSSTTKLWWVVWQVYDQVLHFTLYGRRAQHQHTHTRTRCEACKWRRQWLPSQSHSLQLSKLSKSSTTENFCSVFFAFRLRSKWNRRGRRHSLHDMNKT